MENEITINWGAIASIVSMLVTIGVVIFHAGTVKQNVQQQSQALTEVKKDFSNFERGSHKKFNSMGIELNDLKLKVQDNTQGLANQAEKTKDHQEMINKIREAQETCNIELAALKSGVENIQKSLSVLTKHILKNEGR